MAGQDFTSQNLHNISSWVTWDLSYPDSFTLSSIFLPLIFFWALIYDKYCSLFFALFLLGF
jgi:hypothetical protein